MLFDCSVEMIWKAVGHDGSEILWPDLPEPVRRKGIHVEEIQHAAYYLGWLLADFSPGLCYSPIGDPAQADTIDLFGKLKGVMNKYDGLLLGRYEGRGNHAVAWNAKEQVIYDPAGRLVIPGQDSFTIDTFHAAIRGRG